MAQFVISFSMPPDSFYVACNIVASSLRRRNGFSVVQNDRPLLGISGRFFVCTVTSKRGLHQVSEVMNPRTPGLELDAVLVHQTGCRQ